MTDPDDPAFIARADQAAAEAHALAMSTLADPDSVVLEVSTGAAPEWLIAVVAKHNQLVTSDQGYTCPHLATLHRQRLGVEVVAHLAVWMPGRLACTDCCEGGIFADGLDLVENQTCDVCREHSPGALAQGVFQNDATLIHYGVCYSCHLTKADTRAAPA